MENKSHAFLAGLFTVGLLVAAVMAGIWLNRDREVKVPYVIATSLPIPGLSEQAAVNYRGLNVGRVESITFDAAVPGQILIRMGVRQDTPVTRSTWASLGYQGVTGIAFVSLDDDGRDPVLLKSAPSQPARIPLRPSLLNTLQDRGLVILGQVEELSRRVNNLLNEDNQKAMLQAFNNISVAAEQFQGIPRQLQPTLAQLPALASETRQAARSINRLSQELSGMSASLRASNGPIERVGKTADEIAVVADRIERELLPLTGDIRSTLRLFNRTLENINDRPQSILFGARRSEPGPGEEGFGPPDR